MAGTRAYHDTCSGYHVNHTGARAKTGKLEHDGEPVEERVGQLQMSRRRTRLDSDVGGPFAFSLVRKKGQAPTHLQIWIFRLEAWLAQSETRMQEGTCLNVRAHVGA